MFMPVAARGCFPRIVEDYRTRNSRYKGKDTGKPANSDLVDGIRSFHLADLRHLWADDQALFPQSGTTFRWETWLRVGTVDRLRSEAQRLGLKLGPAPLHFPETDVILVHATPEQMAGLIHRTLCVARLKRSSTTADFFDGLPPRDQAAFATELVDRLRTAPRTRNGSVVCLLDTGVNTGHPLLAGSIHPDDCHVADPAWGLTDSSGHGTELAGIALYGDLTPVLDGAGPIDLPHRLESVKVIPPRGENAYDQLGSITRIAVEFAEVSGAECRRVYCLATSTDEDTSHDGFPTTWSSEIDQLAAGIGVPGGNRRLFCVSGGNVRNERITAAGYPGLNDGAEIESPGQAWNAITVGAMTDKQVLSDPSLARWRPLAGQGDLCPMSRTGCWGGGWPIKPELVLEGGNLAVHPFDGAGYSVPDLALLTTGKDHPNPSFTTTRATSPATAGLARLAALVSDARPDLWPETIRALLVGSASWTPAMLANLPPESPRKADYETLLRRYGYGVPDLGRAMWSASNCLSLIVQDHLQPYRWSEESGRPVINEMKLFRLPWPRDVLSGLQTVTVTMRVTLSYFIEPNPSETARGRKLRYASHGLRFKMIGPDETVDHFRHRINKVAEKEAAGGAASGSDSPSWTLGSHRRDVGSLHSDIWTGPASDLARRNVIAVHPVGGWWKERAHLDRWSGTARFSLVVTIDTGDVDVDVYTPVATAIAAMVTVMT